MKRTELIEKARRFQRDLKYHSTFSEAMAEFALSLQEPEVKPWPQEGDDIWLHVGDGSMTQVVYDENLFMGYLRQGRIHRTEAEAIRANEIEAANAEIRRWRDENCPFVPDYTQGSQMKCHSFYDHALENWGYESWMSKWEVPNVILLGIIYLTPSNKSAIF